MVILHASAADPRAEFLHAALDNPRSSATRLNSIAWRLAIDPTTRLEEFPLIERATAHLVDENPHNAFYRDTYAYVLHREGRIGEAIEQERIALLGTETRATVYTMFLRFLAERGAVDPDAATVRRDGGDVVVASTIPGAVIFAGRPELGLLRIILPDGVREARVAAPGWLPDGALPVWLVDGAGPEPRMSTIQIGAARRDAATAALP